MGDTWRDDIEAAKNALRAKEKLSGCTSYIQRTLGLHYSAAMRIMEELEAQKFITPADDMGCRRLLGQIT